MRADYILPEQDDNRRSRYALFACTGLIVAAMLAGLGDDETTEVTASNTAGHSTPENTADLSQFSPISNVYAMAPAPQAPEPLVDPLEATEHVPLIYTPDLTSPIPDMQPAPQTELETQPEQEQSRSKTLTVRNGDALSILFDRHDLKTADWLALSKLKGDAKRLNRLKPGDELVIALNDDNAVTSLKMRLSDTRRLFIDKNEDGRFEQRTEEDQLEGREVIAQGEIDNSLFLAGKDAGLSDRLIMELAEIFAWDVDFALDIREGDRFTVVYEDLYRDDEKLKEGNILAAEFNNRGRQIRALRYTDEKGRSAYYTPDGKPMKKAFLRNPVDFTRISSRFSKARKHPVLNKIRAHKGVDYAARRGTPVKSAGDGKVIFAGKKGGYGNTIIVQHGGIYTTLYAHLHNFRKGIRRGSSVNQGQTIGYVGSSGLATGPHLHYEFRTHGKHVDPLKVKLPQAPAIAKGKRPRFEQETQGLLAKLEELQDIRVAQLDNSSDSQTN